MGVLFEDLTSISRTKQTILFFFSNKTSLLFLRDHYTRCCMSKKKNERKKYLKGLNESIYFAWVLHVGVSVLIFLSDSRCIFPVNSLITSSCKLIPRHSFNSFSPSFHTPLPLHCACTCLGFTNVSKIKKDIIIIVMIINNNSKSSTTENTTGSSLRQ